MKKKNLDSLLRSMVHMVAIIIVLIIGNFLIDHISDCFFRAESGTTYIIQKDFPKGGQYNPRIISGDDKLHFKGKNPLVFSAWEENIRISIGKDYPKREDFEHPPLRVVFKDGSVGVGYLNLGLYFPAEDSVLLRNLTFRKNPFISSNQEEFVSQFYRDLYIIIRQEAASITKEEYCDNELEFSQDVLDRVKDFWNSMLYFGEYRFFQIKERIPITFFKLQIQTEFSPHLVFIYHRDE